MSVTLGSQHQPRQSQTADSAPGVATWEVARKVVLRVRWPATGITARSL